VLFREIGDRGGEAAAHNGLGEALLALDRPEPARRHHTVALALADGTGERGEQARAHLGLARAGNPIDRLHHARQALAAYTDLGVPEAEQVRAYLTWCNND
jgi:hypothetical protein